MEPRRLFRSRGNQKVAGVCAGLGEYFRFDVTLIRLIFIILTLINGAGVLVYLALWLLVPYQGEGESRPEETIRTGAEEMAERARTVADRFSRGQGADGQRVIGILLILLGLFFALRSIGAIWWLSFGTLWPLFLIGFGVLMISSRVTGRPRSRGGSIFGAVILIGIGGFFLAQNLGLVDWYAVQDLWKFWPVLLILLGLETIFGRSSGVGALVSVLVAISLIAGLFWYVGVPFGAAATRTQVSQPLEGARMAEVTIRHGAGQLRLSDHNQAALLLDGQVAVRPGGLRQEYRLSGVTGKLELRSDRPTLIAEKGGDWLWDLRLNPAVPTRLELRLGAGEAELDLSRLILTGLEVETGAGKSRITLPGRSRFEGRVSGGVGETEIIIPPGVAARVEVSGGIGGTEVAGTFDRDGRYYTTPGYDRADDRIDLRVSNGIGKVTIRFGGR